MKPLAVTIAAISLGMLPLQAANLVAGRIYDVDKYAMNDDDARPTEDWMQDMDLCWAASGATVIQHWQDFYGKLHDEGAELPNGAKEVSASRPSTGCLEVYNYFLKNWTHGPGFNLNTLSWWLQGSLANPPTEERVKRLHLAEPRQPGGFFKKTFTEPTVWKEGETGVCGCLWDMGSSDYSPAPTSPKTRKDLRKVFDAALSHAGQALLLSVELYDVKAKGGPVMQMGHCLACWGYEKGSDKLPDALYFTESDDKQSGVFRVDLMEDEGGLYVASNDPLSRFCLPSNLHVYISSASFINTPEAVAKKKGCAAKLPDKGNVNRNTVLAAKTKHHGNVHIAASAAKGYPVLMVENELEFKDGVVEVEKGAQFTLRGDRAALSANGIRNAGQCYLRGRLHVIGLENAGYMELCNCGELAMEEHRCPGRTVLSGDSKFRIGESLLLSPAKNRNAAFGLCKIESDGIKGTKENPAQIKDAKIEAEGEVITIENAMIAGRTSFKAKGVHLKSVVLTLPDDEHVSVKGKRVEVDATHVFNCPVDGNFNAGLSKADAAKYRQQGCTKIRVTFDPNNPNLCQEFAL